MTTGPREQSSRPAPSRHIVYRDPVWDRPVSQYSPEGEIRMMGDFAAALGRRGPGSRPTAILLVLLILAPVVLGLVALILG